MKNLQETWNYLKKYLEVDSALEQGFSNGKYTAILAKYAKNVTGIDISEDFLNVAKENLKDYKNIKLLIMDAENLTFSDNSFDVLLNTSFHEFDLSSDDYRVDLELKRRILKEMIRVSNTIVFVEPTENAVTNELFKVFNPKENHSDRIRQSNDLIRKFMEENNYELIDSGLTYNKDEFASQEELENEMLDWWADIKIPSSEGERSKMVAEIDEILTKVGMLQQLQVTEEIAYNVWRRK